MKSNWNPNHVPGSSDIAIITNSGNYTVTLDVSTNVGGLVLGATDGSTQTFFFNGQTLTLNGQATVNSGGLINLSSGTFYGSTNSGAAVFNGTLTCLSGALAGEWTVSSNSVLNLAVTSAANSFTGLVLLTNNGTVNWISGNLSGVSGMRSEIDNFGLWDVKTNATFAGGGGSFTFNNFGTFRKSGGTLNDNPAQTTFDNQTAFNNYGTMDVQSGFVNILGGGTGSGIFNTAPTNSNIDLEAYVLTGNPTFLAGNYSGQLACSNAVLHGTLKTSYAVFSGTLTIASNAVFNPSRVTQHPVAFQGVVLTNYGLVVWNGDVTCQSSPQIYNYGLWDDQTNNTFYGSGAVFNNYGTFRKSGGTLNDNPPVTTIDNQTTFNNYGTLDVQSGFVDILGGGTGSGTFNIASNSATGFLISYTLTGNPIFSGSGNVQGNLYGSNAVINGVLTFNNGYWGGTMTLGSNAVVNFISSGLGSSVNFKSLLLTNYGTVNWSNTDLYAANEQIYNYGLWDALTGNTFYGDLAVGNNGSPFNNYGTFRKSGSSSNTNQTLLDANVTFNNYGTVDAQSGALVISRGTDSGLFSVTSNSTISFVPNQPPFILTGNPTFSGTATVTLGGNMFVSNAVVNGTLAFNNAYLAGTLTIASNAVVNLISSGPGSSVNFKSLLLTNFGTVNWNGTDLYAANEQIYNYGLWDAQTGNTFHGDLASGNNGSPFYNYGTFRKSGGNGNSNQTLLDANVTFNNYGTVDAQSGALVLGGNYALAGGTLNFGITSSSDYGSISLVGSATLAGSLSVNFNNNYSPGAGSTFALLGYGSETGVFTTTSLPHLSGLIWQNNYGPAMFMLSVTSLPPMQLSSVTTLNGSSISFSWGTFDGQIYQVQCTTNLSPANWFNLGNPIPGTNGTTTVSDAFGSSPQKFYRVVLPP